MMGWVGRDYIVLSPWTLWWIVWCTMHYIGLNMHYSSVYRRRSWVVQVNRQEVAQMWVLLGVLVLMLWVSSLQTNAEIMHSYNSFEKSFMDSFIYYLIPHVTLHIIHSWYSTAKQHAYQSVSMRFEVLWVVTVKIHVFWDVIPHSLTNVCLGFRGYCSLWHHAYLPTPITASYVINIFSTLMQVAVSFTTLLKIYW